MEADRVNEARDDLLDWLDLWLGEPETRIIVAFIAVLVTFAILWWLA